jgi:hypothetical protein
MQQKLQLCQLTFIGLHGLLSHHFVHQKVTLKKLSLCLTN